jgi:hypothetical protein
MLYLLSFHFYGNTYLEHTNVESGTSTILEVSRRDKLLRAYEGLDTRTIRPSNLETSDMTIRNQGDRMGSGSLYRSAKILSCLPVSFDSSLKTYLK